MIEANRMAMGACSARLCGEVLRQAIQAKGFARLVVATGSSQFEVLDGLVLEPGIDWTKVDGFHLDEYVGLAATHPASFCGYLKTRLVERVPIRSFHYLDGTQDPEDVCRDASSALRASPIDVAMIGIGENGHLAFNDPPADFETRAAYHVVALDEACRRQQVGEGWFDGLDHVPTHAISMTIHEILQSTRIVCSVPDERKARAVAESLEGPLTPRVPASILRTHSRTTVVLDMAAARLLKHVGT